MNAIFCTIFILSAIILCVTNANLFMSAMLAGAQNTISCVITLFCVYTVWMGISAVAEDSGLNRGVAKLIMPLTKKLFKTSDELAAENISLNLTCNLLGLGGAATPFGVKAIQRLEDGHNTFAQMLLFIINATSIQILPTTVIALRAAEGSVSPSDIILPSLLTTAVSTCLAAGSYILICKLKEGKAKWR
jgi:spore maturation protein A